MENFKIKDYQNYACFELKDLVLEKRNLQKQESILNDATFILDNGFMGIVEENA